MVHTGHCQWPITNCPSSVNFFTTIPLTITIVIAHYWVIHWVIACPTGSLGLQLGQSLGQYWVTGSVWVRLAGLGLSGWAVTIIINKVSIIGLTVITTNNKLGPGQYQLGLGWVWVNWACWAGCLGCLPSFMHWSISVCLAHWAHTTFSLVIRPGSFVCLVISLGFNNVRCLLNWLASSGWLACQ